MQDQDYTLREMMTIMAAREIRDGDIVFAGTGISMLAATAAKNINAPNSVIFFETGAIDSLVEELPLAVADPRVMYHTASNAGLLEAFATMQNRITGDKVIAILGAAQIDRYGNLNTTAIGDYHHPEIRFSGSGGGCDVASFVPRCIAFMQHEKRKFVERLDYLTSPGG
jgi:glutaconate CoA-transferase subunit B